MAAGGTGLRLAPPPGIERDASKLRWGVVSTIKAPLPAIARFAAWHLECGAARITIHLDDPDPETSGFLAAHPALRVIDCTENYWKGKPQKARKTHQLRQAFNATRIYRRSDDLDWLAHLDVDEFLLSERPLATLLAEAPDDAAFVRLAPVEQLQTEQGPSLFKRTAKQAGQPKSVLEELYPTFGAHLPGGFIGYTGGKNIVRCGLDGVRMGIHSLTMKGTRVTNGAAIAAEIGHAHAPDLASFLAHVRFRMEHGSYRDLDNGNRALHGILQILKDDGPAGLERLYTEVNLARPELVAGLDGYGMLVRREMGLDALVTRHFGPLPQADAA